MERSPSQRSSQRRASDVSSEQSQDSPAAIQTRRERRSNTSPASGDVEATGPRRESEHSDGKAGLRARFAAKPFEELLNEMSSPKPSLTPRLEGARDSKEKRKQPSLATRLRDSMGHNPTELAMTQPESAENVINHVFLTNTKIASSLTLQQMLFYNAHFACWQLIAAFVSYCYKGAFDRGKHDDMTILMGTLWLAFEPLRILLGYSGNLQEKVPFLAVFMLITAFPQLPITAYFAISQKDVVAFDKALGTVSFVILVAELVASVYAMRQIVKSQDEKFYLEDYEQKKTLINTRTLTERMRRQALGAGDVMEDNRS
mmetsp:Transcript_14329/g.24267  ORF Transcript_14329/g.24267 Transcript_14329/m.24267 type:complete len:316 (+) Transcript_14329:559-1506(+)|eukprot:CAMPEP_0198201250 /NCGR_PEP_ID=MMETSP1445-20131203/3992_1 /TAXON_ID=36898 /ORGANISM="Pyramimonas sp., Strain CCMP2087" /LENGTH=315 /DNA_ID=CAMNT_0043871463 /DNA_START=539 /DNA_END=1486 /DNA_ORIENTATION=+